MNSNYRNTDEVMSVGYWILVMLVLAIPVVNLIMYIIWAFSSNTNPNLSNFCKATLIMGLVGILIAFTFAGCSSILYMI